MSSARMPVLFLGHGSPMNAIEDNAFHREWQRLGLALPKPRAIVVVSAHWETHAVEITAALAPQTIHDFYGFPKPLFDVQYPAKTDAGLIERLLNILQPFDAIKNDTRGWDHGVWAVLQPMYPLADVPILQISLSRRLNIRQHVEIGAALRGLRNEGVMIVGSGDVVHNLRAMSFSDDTPLPWAQRIDDAFVSLIEAGDLAAIGQFLQHDKEIPLAIPTPEHFLPLLYCLGAREEDDRVQVFNRVVQSSISMTSYIFQPAFNAQTSAL